MSWLKNDFKPSPFSKRHHQLWHKRRTVYRKFKLLELYVWAKYAAHEAWLDNYYSIF